jgi:hypothetical protein
MVNSRVALLSIAATGVAASGAVQTAGLARAVERMAGAAVAPAPTAIARRQGIEDIESEKQLTCVMDGLASIAEDLLPTDEALLSFIASQTANEGFQDCTATVPMSLSSQAVSYISFEEDYYATASEKLAALSTCNLDKAVTESAPALCTESSRVVYFVDDSTTVTSVYSALPSLTLVIPAGGDASATGTPSASSSGTPSASGAGDSADPTSSDAAPSTSDPAEGAGAQNKAMMGAIAGVAGIFAAMLAL